MATKTDPNPPTYDNSDDAPVSTTNVDGSPDMRVAENRDKHLKDGERIDGGPDRRVKDNRAEMDNASKPKK